MRVIDGMQQRRPPDAGARYSVALNADGAQLIVDIRDNGMVVERVALDEDGAVKLLQGLVAELLELRSEAAIAASHEGREAFGLGPI